MSSSAVMQRMPNPFETRALALQPAAGGGTCTTSCSCCVATLVASVLLPQAVFKAVLAGHEQATQLEQTGTVTGPAQTADAAPARSADSQAWHHAWRVTGIALQSLLAIALLGATLKTLGLVLGGALALYLLLGVFAQAYRQAGRAPRDGVLAGLGVLVLLAMVLAAELAAWQALIDP